MEIEWQRLAQQELQREFDSICWMHKVKLTKIPILLFASDSHWGQYDSQMQCLRLSEKLITTQSWHQVIGVLKHEMAHQWVAENASQDFLSQVAHGEAFLIACEKLGVSEIFRRASIDLQTSSLDWKQEAKDPESERILNKVQKLLALATSTNQAEALLAMQRVRELYAKYNLENVQRGFVHLVIELRKKRIAAWQQRIISILTEHFFVQAITLQQYQAQSGTKFQCVELIGTRENVLMAEFVFHFLQEQLEKLLDEQKISGGRKRSFRLGVLDGFSKKLKIQDTTTEAGMKVEKALIAFRMNPALDQYLKKSYPRLSSRRGTGQRIDSEAFHAGHEAGRSIRLNKPVTSSSGFLGKLLS